MTTSRILVVEDDARLAATVERVLVAEGHGVEVVGDGLQALRRAREQPFDLVVLDIMLPSLDGVGVCRRLRATSAQVPILLLTALSGTDERVKGLDAGAGSLLLLLLPIGANHGPVALMTNLALPIAFVLLLRKQRDSFS